LLLGLGGVAGTVYGVIVMTRIWHLTLDLADSSCYIALPILANLAIAGAALLSLVDIGLALNVLAVSLVTLLVVGMRNAWDMATFMITLKKNQE
jgi:hypothetical protein